VEFSLKNKLLYGLGLPSYGDFNSEQSATFFFSCEAHRPVWKLKKSEVTPQEFARMYALPRPVAELSGSPMNEERLEHIEAKITFQEDLIEELNKTIYQQQQKLARLEAICESLVRHMESLDEAGNVSRTANERPPHY
jgi:SlyX protein